MTIIYPPAAPRLCDVTHVNQRGGQALSSHGAGLQLVRISPGVSPASDQDLAWRLPGWNLTRTTQHQHGDGRPTRQKQSSQKFREQRQHQLTRQTRCWTTYLVQEGSLLMMASDRLLLAHGRLR